MDVLVAGEPHLFVPPTGFGREFFWVFRWIFDRILGPPLRILYFFGPKFLGIGFWGGMAAVDICATLTGVTATYWDSNELECAMILSRDFGTFEVACVVISYVIILLLSLPILLRFIFLIAGHFVRFLSRIILELLCFFKRTTTAVV